MGSKAPQNLDAKLKEMIAVEVERTGAMTHSPRNPQQAATSA
jgi:hypothetical protein